ncbi:MAG: protein translocase subunit SecDF [Bacteroides sp.]|nr:protein translocase subunit SecDF [Bacteroides sp.]
MQNKGFTLFFAVLLTLVCAFYLSFSFVTRHYENNAKEYANGDVRKEQAYLDSLTNEKVWLGYWTLKECREMEINLGLDLKGGMNVILEVSVPDVIRLLADNKQDETFETALKQAAKKAHDSQDDIITLFVKEYKTIAPERRLAELFATQQLKDRVKPDTSDEEVEKVLREETKSAVENSYNVLRTRIDRFGVVQPNIQSLEDKMGRIMVELPGIKEPERVRKLLQGSANLGFWQVYKAGEVMPILQTIDAKLREIKQDEVAVKDTVEATQEVATSDSISNLISEDKKYEKANMEEFKKNYPLLSLLNPTQYADGPIVGYAHYRDTAQINAYLAMPEIARELPKDLKLHWGVSPSEYVGKNDIFELYAIKSTERDGKAPIEGDVITNARDSFTEHGKPCVTMAMNSDGARRWAQLTRECIKSYIAIVLDGYVYSAPGVSNEITGGRSEITGNFTIEQTKDLANVLNAGKMPAPAKIVQEDIVGPSLGAESIKAGVVSFIIALVLLMIYMCVMYGFIPGMVANSALLLNFFFTLGILSSFQAALTMSGIAGMVLSLGMAVDANVLIYERTKEELRSGKTVKQALADGYSNAFSAIFDSNLTSIITGIILFNFGTGPIRGFATTLIIGILVSFFTAVFVTRLVYEHFMNKGKWLNLSFSSKVSRNLLTNPRINFMSKNKMAFVVLGLVLLVSVAFLSIRGLSQSIDFTGGRNYKVQFEKTVIPEDVRSLLSDKFGDANVSVIAIGTDNKTVRISTNYRIDEDGANVDTEIEAYLYETLKPLLTNNITLETFIDRDNHDGGSIVSSQKVGPSIADDIKHGAIKSVIFALIAIGLYILIRFRNVSYSIGSIVALSADTIIIIGAYSMLWGIVPFSLEIDQTFIGAILTAIGYSINDKVVIFDRIREFFTLYPKRDKTELFNDSLNTTLARTINTSFSTLIVLLCIFILGGDSIRSFAFAMILGVVVGTLSSIFVASPIAYSLLRKKKEKTA